MKWDHGLLPYSHSITVRGIIIGRCECILLHSDSRDVHARLSWALVVFRFIELETVLNSTQHEYVGRNPYTEKDVSTTILDRLVPALLSTAIPPLGVLQLSSTLIT